MKTLEIVKGLAEYYNKEMTPGVVRIYLDALKDLPPELVDLAAREFVKNGKPFMPKVSEIRSTAFELRRASKFNIKDPLQLIPGAAQTEADLDERYGTAAEHRAIEQVFASGGELSDRQRALLGMGQSA